MLCRNRTRESLEKGLCIFAHTPFPLKLLTPADIADTTALSRRAVRENCASKLFNPSSLAVPYQLPDAFSHRITRYENIVTRSVRNY